VAVAAAIPMAVTGTFWLAGSAGADAPPTKTATPAATLLSYSASVESPVVQVTEDNPTAAFHPEGEGELTYSEADVTPSLAHALAAPVWPGSAAANAGTLLGVLGYPAQPELNDPVRAEVSSGTATPTASLNAGVTTAEASVQTASGDTQDASSSVVSGAQGGLGSESSKSTISLSSAGTLTATSTSSASHVTIAGVIDIGSINSTSKLTSANAAAPTGTSNLTFGDVTVVGQPAYIDGSGLHMGSPGHPANPEVAGLIDEAIAASKIEIYVTAAHDVPLGGATYQYGASVLFFWQPPDDPNHDTITFSFGGSAISMVVTAGAATAPVPAPSVSPTSAAPVVAVPTSPTVTGSPGPISSPVASAPSAGGLPTPTTVTGVPTATPPEERIQPAAVSEPFGPRGVTWGWVLLLVAGAILGGVLLPLVPGLLAAAAGPACPRERTFTPTED